MLRHSRCTRTSVYHNVYEQGAEMVTGIQILVCLGDFGQIPGPSSVLFGGCCGVLLLRFCVIIIFCALN